METNDVKERLLSSIHKSESGCWEWLKSLRTGYGTITHEGKTWGAHRLSYTVFVGPIPKGLLICHKCDNPKCINPDHLFVGTHGDNMQDCLKKGRMVIPDGTPFEKGHKPVNRVITPELVKEIKDYIKENYPAQQLKEIAKLFNISYYTIRDMRKKNSRSYVNG